MIGCWACSFENTPCQAPPCESPALGRREFSLRTMQQPIDLCTPEISDDSESEFSPSTDTPTPTTWRAISDAGAVIRQQIQRRKSARLAALKAQKLLQVNTDVATPKNQVQAQKKGEPWTKMHKMQQQSNAAKVLLCNSRWKRQTQCCVQRNVPSACPKSFLQQRGCNSRCLRQQTQQQQQFHCQMQAQLRWGRHRHPQRLQQQCLRFLSFLCRWQMHITSQIMPVLHLPGFTGYYQRCESALR